MKILQVVFSFRFASHVIRACERKELLLSSSDLWSILYIKGSPTSIDYFAFLSAVAYHV